MIRNCYCCWSVSSKVSEGLSYIKNQRLSTPNKYEVIKQEPKQCSEVEPHQNVRYFRANCNYTGFDHTELTFSTRDIIEVVNAYDRHYLYTARHLHTGLVGFVSLAHLEEDPIIELQPWYFNDISRNETKELLLQSSEAGTFLVRKSSNDTGEQAYSLSVLDEDNGTLVVKHYKICHCVNGYFISEGGYSKHLDLLIKMYQDDLIGELGLKISTPCIKDPRFSIPHTDLC